MPVPAGLHRLVQDYSAQRDVYRSLACDDARLRRELLHPLFALLGWDIDKTPRQARERADVVREDELRIRSSIAAPDYAFRVGGTRKFFLAAKKPSVDIATDAGPAHQLRRYAWSAGLDLSILTNFEHLAVYDTRIRPGNEDRASVARILLMTCHEYVGKWEELAGLFSRGAVLDGSLERFAGSTKPREGTVRREDAFLSDIERWRTLLAGSLVGTRLDQRAANAAVQVMLDRIIFLRIAEDRGIEPHGRLRTAAAGPGICSRLSDLFRQADDKYNSGLFHSGEEGRSTGEPPEGPMPALAIDDEPLRAILSELYYPESPYEFSVIPLDVLGQAYERFLGKQIEFTAGGAGIGPKPLVRKVGGVFYTPTHVVNFIVANTLGPLLADKRAGPGGAASRLRVLDPACGSGSFLIGAYQYLLDWHRDRYLEDGPERHRRELFQTTAGTWVLAIDEKKRILANSIFGVDIDEQAVEVTKLSLLLKVLEGESAQTLETQLRLFDDRALPDLSSNIRCGNSLVGSDWAGGPRTRLDRDVSIPVNPFDWRSEYREVFETSGGFDAIIGNPPYVSLQSGFIAPDLRAYLQAHYGSYERITDYFALFLERSHSLLANGGYCGMIVPSTLLGNLSFTRLRELLLRTTSIRLLVHMSDGVFRDAVVPTCILTTRTPCKLKNVVRVGTNVQALADETFQSGNIRQSRFLAQPHYVLNVHASDTVDELLSAVMASSVPLGTLLNIKEGIKTGDDKVFLSDSHS
ncbi:MAG TPA: N-6 DNA methylase, partial [Anaeromyxobacteraceae bacterium]|nr:N-6 DNA methylase [Anaeromyxobacteraceae bacterium]